MTNLKSNMDRFIGETLYNKKGQKINLKSNMDRFIVVNITVQKDLAINLKSNMDRFIGAESRDAINEISGFKIQYG